MNTQEHRVPFTRSPSIISKAPLVVAALAILATVPHAIGAFGLPTRLIPGFGPKSPTPTPTPATATATPAGAQTMAPATSVPPTGTQLPLATIPPLPAGVDLSYTPLPDASFASGNPEQVAAQQAQRARELAADLKSAVPIEDLPAVGTPAFAELRTQALGIVERRYREARAALESDAAVPFRGFVDWQPDFRPAARDIPDADRERAEAASHAVAYAISFLNRPRFMLAFATAVFALDPDSSLAAENAASAIVTCGERLYPDPKEARRLKPYRDDAAVVYRYALALSAPKGLWTNDSLSVLTNLGNLYIDMKDANRARPVVLAARALSPTSWQAGVSLASYYDMRGRSNLARAVLEDQHLAKPAILGALSRSTENINETRPATKLTPESPEEAFTPVLEKFDTVPVLTAADFVGLLDRNECERMRKYLNDLPVQGSYRAPGIDLLTQFGTCRAINEPAGARALGDFGERLGSYTFLLVGSMQAQLDDSLGQLGLGMQLNVDMKDVMAHPERYQNREIKGTVTGTEGLQARVAERRRLAEQAQRDVAAGRTDTLLQMAAQSDPILAVHNINPYAFANPMDVLVQKHNAWLLARKMNTYNAYFRTVNNRTRKLLTEVSRLHAQKCAAVDAQEQAELEIFHKKQDAAARAGQDIHSAYWRQLEHNIHMKFAAPHNTAAQAAWAEATRVAGSAYNDKIKPRAERFYYDVFRHIALISDQRVRAEKNREFEKLLHVAVYEGLVNALSAYAGYEYTQDWDCGCDVGALLAQAEQERHELDAIANEAMAREKQEKRRFESGEIPESSKLFKQLDEYGTDLDIPFIKPLSGRISCARTTLKLGLDVPFVPGAPKMEYTFTESAFTGATTHNGGLQISVKTESAPGTPTASATVSVRGSVSRNGQGTVTDYSAATEASVNLEIGPATFSTGGELGYSKAGGLTSDVNVGTTISLTDELGFVRTVGVKTSAQRGSTLSAKVEKVVNPYSGEIQEMSKEMLGDLSDVGSGPTSTVELWSGEYTRQP